MGVDASLVAPGSSGDPGTASLPPGTAPSHPPLVSRLPFDVDRYYYVPDTLVIRPLSRIRRGRGLDTFIRNYRAGGIPDENEFGIHYDKILDDFVMRDMIDVELLPPDLVVTGPRLEGRGRDTMVHVAKIKLSHTLQQGQNWNDMERVAEFRRLFQTPVPSHQEESGTAASSAASPPQFVDSATSHPGQQEDGMFGQRSEGDGICDILRGEGTAWDGREQGDEKGGVGEVPFPDGPRANCHTERQTAPKLKEHDDFRKRKAATDYVNDIDTPPAKRRPRPASNISGRSTTKLGATEPDCSIYRGISAPHIIFLLIELKWVVKPTLPDPVESADLYAKILSLAIREATYQMLWYLHVAFFTCHARLAVAQVNEFFGRAFAMDDGTIALETSTPALELEELRSRQDTHGVDSALEPAPAVTVDQLDQLSSHWERLSNSLIIDHDEWKVDETAGDRFRAFILSALYLATKNPGCDLPSEALQHPDTLRGYARIGSDAKGAARACWRRDTVQLDKKGLIDSWRAKAKRRAAAARGYGTGGGEDPSKAPGEPGESSNRPPAGGSGDSGSRQTGYNSAAGNLGNGNEGRRVVSEESAHRAEKRPLAQGLMRGVDPYGGLDQDVLADPEDGCYAWWDLRDMLVALSVRIRLIDSDTMDGLVARYTAAVAAAEANPIRDLTVSVESESPSVPEQVLTSSPATVEFTVTPSKAAVMGPSDTSSPSTGRIKGRKPSSPQPQDCYEPA